MRNQAVTITKAIGIILMVMDHASTGMRQLNIPIELFHMPLFFIMSGFCFNASNNIDFLTYVKKKLKGIWWPFVKYCTLFLILHNLFYSIGFFNDNIGFRGQGVPAYSVRDYIIIFASNVLFMNKADILLGGYWFLHTLFWSSLLTYLIITYANKYHEHKSVWIITTAVLLLLGGAIMTSGFNLRIPLLDIGCKELMATSFMLAGYLIRLNIAKISFLLNSVYFDVFSVVLLVMGSLFWATSMIGHQTEYILPYFITAITSTMLIYKISTHIENNNERLVSFYTYIGDRTLEILTWHFLCFKIVSLLIIYIYNANYEIVAEHPIIQEYAHRGWWLAYLITGLVVPLFIEWVTTKITSYIRVKLIR